MQSEKPDSRSRLVRFFFSQRGGLLALKLIELPIFRCPELVARKPSLAQFLLQKDHAGRMADDQHFFVTLCENAIEHSAELLFNDR